MGTLVFQATLGGQVNLTGPNTASTFTINVPALSGTMASLASVTNNGVTYVNSSGQPTTGSALTFDGTNFLTTGSATGTAFIPSGSTVPTNGMYLPTTNSVAWSTNSAERARITNAGDLLVNTTTTGGWSGDATMSTLANGSTRAWGISAYNNTAVSGGAMLARVDNTTRQLLGLYYSTTNVGSITTNGTITVYGGTSDYRLKTVIGPIIDPGQRIDALEPIEYTWDSNGSRTRGFLAHKFQEVYADSVTGTKDEIDANGKPVYQGMQAGSAEVIADLVAEIQSLRKRLTALEQK